MEGSSTCTGSKRRSSAASFSMCLRYSSNVVAPMVCSSPRANFGLSKDAASIAPSAAPAPTKVWISSMNKMISPRWLSSEDDTTPARHPRRLINLYRLEPTLQRRVLVNVLAVLIQRGRTNGLQLTASQLRFEQGRRIDSAFCGTCADQGVDLVDEQDDIAALVNLLQHLLQALFEVTAVTGTGHQRT